MEFKKPVEIRVMSKKVTLLPCGHEMICHAAACNKTSLLWHGFFYTCTHLLSRQFFNCVVLYFSNCIQIMRGKLPRSATTPRLPKKKYRNFHLDSEFFLFFRFHSHYQNQVRFRPSLYFTSSFTLLFPNLTAVAF